MQNRKNDIKFHEDMKLSSISVYGQKPMPPAYSMLGAPIENKSNGFYAQVWKKGNDIVIVYRGTELKPFLEAKKDVNNDIAMVRGKIPAQTTDALALHDRIKREYPDCTITLTGHSLGGSLAQIVSAIRGTFAVTFNAYGTRNMFKDPENLKEDNIVNYIDEYDPLAMQNAENNVGVTYSVTGQRKAVIGNHFIDDMPPLETRVLKSKAGLLHAKEYIA